MPIEVEARFRAARHRVLDQLSRIETLGPAALGAASTVAEQDRYLDTADGRLAAARWACRLRSRNGLTRVSLKGPPDSPSIGWLHRRPEVEGAATDEPDPGTWPPSEARDRLLELSAGAPLHERLRLRQSRTERRVGIGQRAVGTLSLDAVVVEHRGASVGNLFVVELELGADGSPDSDLPVLASALESFGDLEPEPRTKLELALSLVGSV